MSGVNRIFKPRAELALLIFWILSSVLLVAFPEALDAVVLLLVLVSSLDESVPVSSVE